MAKRLAWLTLFLAGAVNAQPAVDLQTSLANAATAGVAMQAQIAALQQQVTTLSAQLAASQIQIVSLNAQVLALTPVPILPPPSGAKLLFSSGFEGSTALSTPGNCFGTGCWQNIVGTDSSTGFQWPISIWGGGATSFQLIAAAPVDASTVGSYMFNQIQTVTGHGGSSTQALYQQISKSGVSGTGPNGGPAQDPLILQPAGETSDLYIRYWLKYQPDLAKILTNGWRVVFEFKTAGDYRVIAEVVTWGLASGGVSVPLSWEVVGDNEANGGLPYQRFWDVYNTTVPVPVGDWFKFEVFWHRSSGSDGRVWMAVNGQTIVDRRGANMGVNNAPINRIMMPNLYSSTAYPIYQWVDDIQIWDGFPSDAAPH